MGLFRRRSQNASEVEKYQDLADPGTPFKRRVLSDLLDELRKHHQTVDARVTNVPHGRFDEISWDFYYRPGDDYDYVGQINYYTGGELGYVVRMKVTSFRTAIWGADDEEHYPLDFIVTPVQTKELTEQVHFGCVTAYTFDPDDFQCSAIVSDLLAGFADAALNILGKPPLKVGVIHAN